MIIISKKVIEEHQHCYYISPHSNHHISCDILIDYILSSNQQARIKANAFIDLYSFVCQYLVIINWALKEMQKLFQIAYLRNLQKLAGQSSPPYDIAQLVRQLGPASGTDALLHRLPREQLKYIANTPCPINNFEQTDAVAIINSSKVLRSHIRIDEGKVCARCPFAKQCSFASKPYEGTPSENVLTDVIVFMGGLNAHLKPELINFKRWEAAYKLGDNVLACIEDISKGGQELAEHERLRQEAIASYKNNPPAEDKQEKQEKENEKEQLKTAQQLPKKKAVEEPAEKITKKSHKPKKNSQQQGLNEQVQVKGDKYEKTERTPYKPKYDNFTRDDKPNRSNKQYDQEQRTNVSQNRQQKKYYNREQRGSKYEGNNYNKNYENREKRDQSESRNYEGRASKYDARDKYGGPTSFNNKYEGKNNWQQKRQDSWKDKGQDRKNSNDNRERSNSYNSERSSRPERDSYTNNKEYGKKQEYNNKPRNTDKPSPFINKWQNESNSPSESRQRTPSSFSEVSSKSQQKPRIISMESINESNPSNEESQTAGRSIRGAGRRRARE